MLDTLRKTNLDSAGKVGKKLGGDRINFALILIIHALATFNWTRLLLLFF